MFNNAITFTINEECNREINITYFQKSHITPSVNVFHETHFLHSYYSKNDLFYCKYINISIPYGKSMYRYYKYEKFLEFSHLKVNQIKIPSIIQIEQVNQYKNQILKYSFNKKEQVSFTVDINLERYNLNTQQKNMLHMFGQINKLEIINKKPLTISKTINHYGHNIKFLNIDYNKNHCDEYIKGTYSYEMDILYNLVRKSYFVFKVCFRDQINIFSYFIYNKHKYLVFKVIHDPVYTYIYACKGIPFLKSLSLGQQNAFVENHILNILPKNLVLKSSIIPPLQEIHYKIGWIV